MPSLKYKCNLEPVLIGDVVHIRNTPYVITGWREPHKPSSTGRVYVQSMDEKRMTAEYFPSVIGAGWLVSHA